MPVVEISMIFVSNENIGNWRLRATNRVNKGSQIKFVTGRCCGLLLFVRVSVALGGQQTHGICRICERAQG